jgi:hypothetical protein
MVEAALGVMIVGAGESLMAVSDGNASASVWWQKTGMFPNRSVKALSAGPEAGLVFVVTAAPLSSPSSSKPNNTRSAGGAGDNLHLVDGSSGEVLGWWSLDTLLAEAVAEDGCHFDTSLLIAGSSGCVNCVQLLAAVSCKQGVTTQVLSLSAVMQPGRTVVVWDVTLTWLVALEAGPCGGAAVTDDGTGVLPQLALVGKGGSTPGPATITLPTTQGVCLLQSAQL